MAFDGGVNFTQTVFDLIFSFIFIDSKDVFGVWLPLSGGNFAFIFRTILGDGDGLPVNDFDHEGVNFIVDPKIL